MFMRNQCRFSMCKHKDSFILWYVNLAGFTLVTTSIYVAHQPHSLSLSLSAREDHGSVRHEGQSGRGRVPAAGAAGCPAGSPGERWWRRAGGSAGSGAPGGEPPEISQRLVPGACSSSDLIAKNSVSAAEGNKLRSLGLVVCSEDS